MKLTPEKEKQYRKAFVELYEIFKHLDVNQKSLIPETFIDNVRKKRDLTYTFEFDSKKRIFEQNLMTETKALIVKIYERFFASPDEKEWWEKYHVYCQQQIAKQKIQHYEKMLEEEEDNT